MHWILIMFLTGSPTQLESGVKYKTLAECEAAGQMQMRGQGLRPFYSNYVCKKKGAP